MIGTAVLAAGCSELPCPGQRVEAFSLGDLNPLKWLGNAASAAVGDVWLAAMTGLWSASLWLLKLAFGIIDAFTTPDLSASGPIGSVLPTTLWIGATLAVIMMFVQLTVALIRRDGESMGRVLLGIAQFGFVWVAYLGLAAGFVAAASGLERGILQGMLHAQDLSQVDLSANFPDKIGDITLATVLGVLGLLIVMPAAFFYLLIMFVREAALIILVATAPISASGLVSETGKAWFWKTLRWFFSCLLISPMAALLLGIGVKLSTGIIAPPAPPKGGGIGGVKDYANSVNTAHAGMAVVGCIVIAIGACCPMILFRLLAFVEPGTASGAALRQSWSDAGGMSGIMSGGKQSSGSSAATQSSGDGRSGGESGAESQTQSRLSSALGAFGAGMQVATSVAHKAADIGSDILGQAGVGSPGYSMTPTDERSSRSSGRGGSSSKDWSSDSGGAAGGSGGRAGGGPTPEPPTPPTPPMPGGGGLPGGGGGLPVNAAGVSGAGGAGAAGGPEAAVAVVAL
jgi:type IV secretion system protein TrbL